MAHNAGAVNALALTEQTTIELNDLIGGTLTGGNVLIAQGGGRVDSGPRANRGRRDTGRSAHGNGARHGNRPLSSLK